MSGFDQVQLPHGWVHAVPAAFPFSPAGAVGPVDGFGGLLLGVARRFAGGEDFGGGGAHVNCTQLCQSHAQPPPLHHLCVLL